MNKAIKSFQSETKEKLQNLVFPEGIVYDKVKKVFRTNSVNSVFSLIAELTHDSGAKEKWKSTYEEYFNPFSGEGI